MESFRQTKKTGIDTNKDSAYWVVENMDANCIGSCMFAAFVLWYFEGVLKRASKMLWLNFVAS